MLKTTLTLFSLSFMVIALFRCSSDTNKDKTGSTRITPVELTSYVDGFSFPEDSGKIYKWVNANDSASMYKHAWGIWAGLTEPTDQTYAGDQLLVFETWQGIDEIRANIQADSLNAGCAGTNSRIGRAKLTRPHQFTRRERTKKLLFTRSVADTIDTPAKNPADFWVTVSYSPDAACYATTNQLLRKSVLNNYKVAGGIGRIPPFPQKSITIKPAYFVGQEKDHLIQIPVVTENAPSTTMANGSVWAFTNWPRVVYADVQNKQPKNKKVIPALMSDKTAEGIEKATCNVNDFIHFKLDQKMAEHMNKSDDAQFTANGSTPAAAGQLAILVAMHVTTKEISNWTWQTFYWAPDPDQVYRPSSALAARLRPNELKGAAGHYALNVGYSMVIPNQPITGGTNKGVSVQFSYNPYLEGGFSGLHSRKDTNGVFDKKSPISQPYGVQSNCMSCHAYANSDPGEGFYVSDEYVDMKDKFFTGKVQLDFAWSIQNNMIDSTDTKKQPSLSAKKEYIRKLALATNLKR